MAEPTTDSATDADKGGSPLDKFRYEYGAQPLHLIAILATLALAGYAFLRIFENPSTLQVLLWLGAAIVAHDFIALPFYTGLNRAAHGASDTVMGFASPQNAHMALNHVRIPAGFSLILLLVSLPLILGINHDAYESTIGTEADGYLRNWLLMTAAMFAISGIALAIRMRRSGQRTPERGVVPPDTPGVGWKIAARLTLGVGALLVLWVAAALVVGLINNPPF